MDIQLVFTLLSLLISVVTQIAGQCLSTNDGNPRCYIYVSTPNSWADADELCEIHYGGYSVQVHDDSELALLTDYLSGQSVNTVWMGATAMYTDWIWEDGTEIGDSYSNWASGDHIYYMTGLACATISVEKSNQWTKTRCRLACYFICEIESTSPSCVATGDTNIKILNDRCYLTNHNLLPWTESLNFCTSLGGSLAKVTSLLIQEAVESLVDTGETWHKYWIGLRQDQFYWSTGTPVSTFYWSDTQKGIEGNCVKLHREDGESAQWFLDGCNKELPVVCQIDSDPSSRIAISTKFPPTPTTTTTTQATTKPATSPRTTKPKPKATDPPATDPPVISVTAESKGPSKSVTAGLAVMVVIVFAILVALLVFFFYYKRRNTLLKKAARADAARLEAENGGGRVNFDHPGISEEVAGPSTPSSLFTTSQTTSDQQQGGPKHTKYTTHYKENKNTEKPLSRLTSQISISTDDESPRKNTTPHHTPRPLDSERRHQGGGGGQRRQVTQSRVSLKSDSEGASETDEGGMRRGYGGRTSDVDAGRSSRRKNLSIRRSNSKVRPADVVSPGTTDSEGGSASSPKPRPEQVYRTDSMRGSQRKGGHHHQQLPPLEKQSSQDDGGMSSSIGDQQPTVVTKKKKPRAQRIRREGEETDGEERAHRKKQHRPGDAGTAAERYPPTQDSDGDVTTERYRNNAAQDRLYSREEGGHGYSPVEGGSLHHNGTSDHQQQEQEEVAKSEHRGRGQSKRARVNKKSSKYSLESDSKDSNGAYYVKKKNNVHGDSTHDGEDTYSPTNGYGDSGVKNNGYHQRCHQEEDDYYEPSLALQTVNTVDIDCVSDVEVDSLPDDENGITLDSFV